MSAEAEIQIASLLYATFTSGNTAQRNEAEAQLAAYSRDLPAFAHVLLGLLASTQVSSLIKSSAAIYLRHSLSAAISNSSLDLRVSISQQLFSVLSHSDLQSPHIESLCFTLAALLRVDNWDIEGRSCRSLQCAVKEIMNAGDFGEVMASLRVARIIFEEFARNEESGLEDFYAEIGATLVKIGTTSLQPLQSSSEHPDTLKSLYLLCELTATFRAAFDYFAQVAPTVLIDLATAYQPAETLRVALGLSAPGTRSVIALDGSPAANAFNAVKSQAILVLNGVLKVLVDRKRQGMCGEAETWSAALPPCSFVSIALEALPWFISSLEEIGIMGALDYLEYSEATMEAVVAAVALVDLCAGEPCFYSVFTEKYKGLIVNVCIAFAHCSSRELQLLKSNPEEFAAVALDTCQQQESATAKSAASRLLLTLCSSVDGALSYTVTLLSQLLDFTITGSYYSLRHLYPTLMEAHSLLSLGDETKVATGLMALAVVAPLAFTRSDLSPLVERYVLRHVTVLANTGSELVQARLALFLAQLATIGNLASTGVDFLLFALNPDAVSGACYFQACMCFASLDPTALSRVKESPNALQALVGTIEKQEHPGFFDALQELVSSDSEVIAAVLEPLLHGLVTTITAQQVAVGNDASSDSLLIAKSWAVIRALVQSPQLQIQQLRTIEDAISVFTSAAPSAAIHFEDEIVLVWTALITRSQAVSTRAWEFFQCLPLIQQKYQGRLGQLFPAVNAYVAYGAREIEASREWVDIVVKMSRDCLFAGVGQSNPEASQTEGLLLLQQALLSFHGALDASLPGVLTFLLQRYSQPLQTMTLRLRILTTVFSAFAYNSALAWELLAGNTLEMVREVEGCEDNFKNEYDRKVAEVGMMAAITAAGAGEVEKRLFSAVIGVLYVKKTARVEVLQVPGVRSKPDYSDEEPTAPDLPVPEATAESDLDLPLQQFLSPLCCFDEIEHFQCTLKSLADFHPAEFQSLLHSLSPRKAGLYRELIASKRVWIDGQTTVRKVVKAKRRLGRDLGAA